MTRLALCLLLLATGASAEQLTDDIKVVHDQKRCATCWVLYGSYGSRQAIFCIPDSQLQAGNERQLSPHETQPEPTPAAAPAAWNDERYQL
ncbi:hypothetical protein [Pseudomonas mosselii]|uniref:DUF2946 domain-containing protein n=1 Tax=Pseudomonas mosselii TaxID=78327 RepID=A0ABX9ATX9_9PSED|nr:hypothetical protein [Pseudomonas mosselii]QZP24534.1 hypothetical protein K5H97_17010 [Pseudomonas mosselii]